MGQPLTFGALLKRYRIAAGLTQEELAERARLSRRGISDLERGMNRTPRRDTVALLAAALQLPAREHGAFEAAARGSLALPARHDPVSPPLVGRGGERALLERHLAGEGPPLLLLAGEPGIGKTRLLRVAQQQAAQGGWCVLEGGCQQHGGQEPYAPILGALDRHIDRLPPAGRRTALHGCAWLVRLLPELAGGPIEPLPSWTVPPEQERRLMVKALLRFLANVAGPAGTVLALDDLQWAGADALDMLTLLVHSAPEVPLRLVGAYRDTEVGPSDAFWSVLGDLAQAGLVARHALGPLAPDDAARLFDAVLRHGPADDRHSTLRAEVVRRTGGVPFFVVSCAQALTDAGDVVPAAETVPWDVGQSIRRRVAALPEVAREVAGTAAVVGRVAPRALLAGVVARSEEALVAVLEVLCRARLLEDGGDGAYRFAHDVIREVVEADLGTARRMLLHRRVAEALERQPGESPVAQLAYHYERSDMPDRAAGYHEQAGDRAAARHALAAAEEHYRRALGHVEALARPLTVARVREKVGAALITLARHQAALDVLVPAVEAYHAHHDWDGLARSLAQVVLAHARNGTASVGLHYTQPWLALLESADASAGLAALYTAQMHLYLGIGRVREQRSVAERAVELARRIGDERLRAGAEWGRGWALVMLGQVEEGRRVLEEVVPLAEAVGDLDTLHEALGLLGQLCVAQGKMARAGVYHGRALEVAERRGDPAHIVLALCRQATGTFYTGDWERTRADLERAAQISREIGPSWFAPLPLRGRAFLCLAEGAWEEAAAHLEQAQAQAEGSGDVESQRIIERALAEADVLAGKPERARARLLHLLEWPDFPDSHRIEVLPVLAQAHLDMAAVTEARRVADQAVQGARSGTQPLLIVEALRVHALVTLAQGQWTETARSLDEALTCAQALCWPYAEARLLTVYGRLHVATGETETARERLQAAQAVFQRLGARADLAATRHILAALAGRHALP
jgi:transcriptional regulator with XRE-family HTH domain/tetratricopeptide (TPR) repeat protein